MKKTFNTELPFLFASLILLFLFLFFYGYVYSLDELSEKMSFTKMPNSTSIFYFWMVIFYIITLIRQFKLKFNDYISNYILIIIGSILFYFFMIFAANARLTELIVEKNMIIYKTKNFTKGVIVFRSLQLLVGVLVIFSTIKCVKKKRMEIN